MGLNEKLITLLWHKWMSDNGLSGDYNIILEYVTYSFSKQLLLYFIYNHELKWIVVFQWSELFQNQNIYYNSKTIAGINQNMLCREMYYCRDNQKKFYNSQQKS